MNYLRMIFAGSLLLSLYGCTVAPTPTHIPSASSQPQAPNNNHNAPSETYTVKKGDTVFSIMRETGVYWKDIIEMNDLEEPSYIIVPGQVIILKEAVTHRDVTAQ